jgi:hypothetical protein
MANANGWGDGASNNDIGWGQGADNTIGWGSVYSVSEAGATDIIGTPPVPPYSYLLDDYSSAAAAYSLRKLRSAYTGDAIRVRRSSDNTEQDFGFVSNVLDTASLLTFCGAGNGFVTTWYDQSGNANNATQTTAANQPQIVSSGAMITINGKNSMSFDGSNDSFNLASTINVASSNYNSFVGKRAVSGRRLVALTGGVGQQYFFALNSDNNYYLQGKTTHYQVSSATDTTTNQLLLTGLNSAGTMSMYKNGSTITSSQLSAAITNQISTIGNYLGGNGFLVYADLQEIVFYNSDQTSNRNGIESNINTFYTIY